MTRVDLRQIEPTSQRVVMRGEAFDLPRNGIRISQISDTQGSATDFVFVRRADAAHGGADRRGARLLLARRVEITMERQNEAGLVGKNQNLRGDRHALLLDLLDLARERPRIDND